MSWALKALGLNRHARALKSATGIDALYMIHSPIPGICFGVEHREAVMMFGCNDDVLHPGRLGEGHDIVRAEADRIELRGERLVVRNGDGGIVHEPLPSSRRRLAVPRTGGDGVKTPMDEHAEAGIPPPGHACVTLRGRFGILDRGHGMC